MKLREGYTTGSCVCAASKAGLIYLLSDKELPKVMIEVVNGVKLYIDVYDFKKYDDGSVSCFVVKDGGDDIDVTTGLRIYVYLKKINKGIELIGGEGVGLVTKKGLKVAVGMPAINPKPREMIIDNLSKTMKFLDYQEGLEVRIVIPKGKEIAKKTFNERLGIINGISILGTTGIVKPMSEASLIESIKLEIDVLVNEGKQCLLLTPGNYGSKFCLDNYRLKGAINYSNYMGLTLDHLLNKDVTKILIVGHIGKLVKVAAAIMNTHSKYGDGRHEIIGYYASLCGLSNDALKRLDLMKTTDEMHELLVEEKIAEETYKLIEKRIIEKIKYRTLNEIEVGIIAFNFDNEVLIRSDNALSLIKVLKEEEYE